MRTSLQISPPRRSCVLSLQERRKALGGYVPERRPTTVALGAPDPEHFKEFIDGTGDRALGIAKATAPVDSGDYRDGLHIEHHVGRPVHVEL